MKKKNPSVSIIVPARDEAGTIKTLINRLPKMGSFTEIIFVEGFSTDNTWGEIRKAVLQQSTFVVKGYRQKTTKGKKNAVDIGFKHATGDIFMILDADLSVEPEILPKFYKALVGAQGDFVNGSRFVHPKEKGAMRYLNHLGNKFFAAAFSLLLKERVTDTLCGTKVFWRTDYNRILKVTKEFSHVDPYGDFQLFLGAALLKLKICEIPVKYRARVYGQTKISRFRDGIKLLKVLFLAYISFAKQRGDVISKESKRT